MWSAKMVARREGQRAQTHPERLGHLGELALLLHEGPVGHTQVDVNYETFPVRQKVCVRRTVSLERGDNERHKTDLDKTCHGSGASCTTLNE